MLQAEETAAPIRDGNAAKIVEKPKFDFEHKIIIIGDAGAGKSSFFHQFLEGKFKKQIMQTIGVEFGTKIVPLQNDDRRVKLNVWDTAGQERYRAVTRAYYRGAMGCVILFDITSEDSFRHVPDWLQDAKEQGDENIDIIVVGNKSDLAERRQVQFKDANSWALGQSVMFLETSARTGDNVQEVFQILAQQMQARADKAAESRSLRDTAGEGVTLTQPSHRRSNGQCCA